MGMGNDGHRGQGGVAGTLRANGFIPSSFRAFSSYLRIVSSGASTVASSVRSAASAASAIIERDDAAGQRDQVLWAGFDKLECEGGTTRQVLLLGYRSGFQVWDVEDAHNVRDLVSKHDGPVSFLQMLPRPLQRIMCEDRFSDSRPMLVLSSDASVSVASTTHDRMSSSNGSRPIYQNSGNGSVGPSVVLFYSLSSQSYVHDLKFTSLVYSVRSSARVIAICQSAQIHCLNAATLEKEYTILTNPVVTSGAGCGGVSYGPLAVGPRWLAYSGSPVAVSASGRVTPQHLTPSASFPGPAPNGSLVAHYAMESSKQLAAGIVTLGDIGYKTFSRYYSELRPDSSHSAHSISPSWDSNGNTNGNLLDADSVGMVIVRDVCSKSVITQFRAHRSPISALCFDPSGILLVTASVQGHNINVFRIIPGLPGNSSEFDAENSYVHLYRLQRGLTNAVIQDISFSDDSRWIMVSSSRGTNHLFAISPSGGAVNIEFADASFKNDELVNRSNPPLRWPNNLDIMNHPTICASGPPVTLSVVSRIRSGSNGWKGTVGGAAAAAAGRIGSLSGAIASSFHHCKDNDMHGHACSLKAKYHLLLFSPSGCLIQYALRLSSGADSASNVTGFTPLYEPSPGIESKLIVEAIQKWNICHKQVRREREDITTDIYGESAKTDSGKLFTDGNRKVNSIYPVNRGAIPRTEGSPEERHHLYISEAELQMHQEWNPFWAKSEIYFQSMIAISSELLEEETTAGGEIEIERVPTRPIEMRSKNLIPVFNYLQKPKSQQGRLVPVNSNFSPQLQHQMSGMSQNGGLSRRSSSCSIDSLTECGAPVGGLRHGTEEAMDGVLQTVDTSEGSVNSLHGPKTMPKLESVYNRDRERLAVEAQLRVVNNNNGALRSEDHFEDEGDEFD
ncbi:hypothetical protein Dimus_012559 [Dionaea muscipula]